MLRARRGGRGMQSSGPRAPRAAQERAYRRSSSLGSYEHRMSSYGAGIGSSGLPSAIDEQLSPAGRPAKRESRDRPAEDADLVRKHSAVRAAPSRQRYTAVQAEQRPPVGRLVLDDDLNVAHRRTRSAGKKLARRQSPLRTDP